MFHQWVSIVVGRLMPDIQQILLAGFFLNALPELLPDLFATAFLIVFLQHLLPDVCQLSAYPEAACNEFVLSGSQLSQV